MIAALAGRRVDAPGAATPRFPAGRVGDVERSIRRVLEADGVRTLVCAAACGADLLALSAAAELGVRCRIVLPFAPDVFKERSVVDRPGPHRWGELYDRFVREAEERHDLVRLGYPPDDPAAFELTNEAILEEASSLARSVGEGVEALLVWDGRLRTSRDYTEHFGLEAQRRGIPCKSIPILGS